MKERGTSLRAAHLVLWSSPILLLVLVFTMTNPTTSAKILPAASPVRGTSSPPTTSDVVPSTMTTAVAKSTVATTTTEPTAVVDPRSTFVAQSSTKTTVTEPVTAPTPFGGVRGSLVGRLGPAGSVVDVPLQGPGSWIVQATSTMSEALSCGGPPQAVAGLVSVTTLTACDLRLTSWSTTPMTWQVVPTQ